MTGESRYCTGLDEQTCIFGAEGSAARPHGTLQCLFCDPVRLATAVFERDPHVLKRFKLLTAEAQKLALQRTGTDRDRQWLQSRQANAADLAGHDGPLEEELVFVQKRGGTLEERIRTQASCRWSCHCSRCLSSTGFGRSCQKFEHVPCST